MKKGKEVCVIGAGGQARAIVNIIDLARIGIQGIYDDNRKTDLPEVILGYQVLGGIKDIPEGFDLVLAVGDNVIRERLYKDFESRVLKTNLRHASAIIEKEFVSGKSNQILANVYISTCVKIGNNNILNTGCIIEHEVHLGSHNHISVGSILCGRVSIGDGCFIGAGSVVIDKINICDGVTIGANSTVIDNINESGTYVGSPVRKIK